jgi:hypothetical protein
MGNRSPKRQLDQATDDDEPVSFKVHNVDAKLFKHSKGLLKITSDEMILYQDNQNLIHWPLNGIRRYGYYQNIFLFESGRKCPTGEGLYAFKCKIADKLNSTLHKTLLRKELSNEPKLEPLEGTATRTTITANNETFSQKTATPTLPLPLQPHHQQQTFSHKHKSSINNIIYEDEPNVAQYVNEFALIKLPNNADTEKIIDACFDSKANRNTCELVYTTLAKNPYEHVDNNQGKNKTDQKSHKFDYTVINNEKTMALKESQASRTEYLNIATAAAVAKN